VVIPVRKIQEPAEAEAEAIWPIPEKLLQPRSAGMIMVVMRVNHLLPTLTLTGEVVPMENCVIP